MDPDLILLWQTCCKTVIRLCHLQLGGGGGGAKWLTLHLAVEAVPLWSRYLCFTMKVTDGNSVTLGVSCLSRVPFLWGNPLYEWEDIKIQMTDCLSQAPPPPPPPSPSPTIQPLIPGFRNIQPPSTHRCFCHNWQRMFSQQKINYHPTTLGQWESCWQWCHS